MDFAPKPGCPMCGIVATAQRGPVNSPRSPSFPAGSKAPEVLWRDDNFTVYREKTNPVSSKGHLIIAFNLHVPSIYTLSSSDVPLLISVKSLALRFLATLAPSSQSDPSVTSGGESFPAPLELAPGTKFHVGFITPPFRDPKIPVTDHLHAHAYLEPANLMGWWRGVNYSGMAWYNLDDLIAEIRESTSNNRIRSGHDGRTNAPIDQVPDAGARAGHANGHEMTEGGVASADLEAQAGDRPRTPFRRGSDLLSPPDQLSSPRPSTSSDSGVPLHP